MAVLVGLNSLLPASIGYKFQNNAFLGFATFLIMIFLLGLLIGEAVHTFAETIEKSIFTPLRAIKHYYRKIRGILINAGLGESQSAERRREHIEHSGILTTIKIKLYWNLNLIFKQHRMLLIDIIKSNYDYFLGAWRTGEKGELFDRFRGTIESDYDVDIRDNPEKLSFIYPSIMSRLYMSRARLSKRFQVIYAFCRSMWMTSLLLTAGYLYVLYVGDPNKFSFVIGEQYTPIAVEFFKSNPLPFVILPILTGATTLGFLAACGKYKYHYIEYIIADFPSLVEIERDRNPQTEIDDWEQRSGS